MNNNEREPKFAELAYAAKVLKEALKLLELVLRGNGFSKVTEKEFLQSPMAMVISSNSSNFFELPSYLLQLDNVTLVFTKFDGSKVEITISCWNENDKRVATKEEISYQVYTALGFAT